MIFVVTKEKTKAKQTTTAIENKTINDILKIQWEVFFMVSDFITTQATAFVLVTVSFHCQNKSTKRYYRPSHPPWKKDNSIHLYLGSRK